MSTSRNIGKEIDVLIRARYPIIYIVSYEEKRVEKLVSKIARSQDQNFKTWTVTKGVVEYSESRKRQNLFLRDDIEINFNLDKEGDTSSEYCECRICPPNVDIIA